MELDIKDKIIKQEKELIDKIVCFKNCICFINKMVEKPDETIVELSKDTTLNVSDSFKALVKPLQGTFTRDQTISLARDKLGNILSTSIQDISNLLDLLDIKNFVKALNEETSLYINNIYSNVDPMSLITRKQSYLRNSVTIEFFKKKLNSSFDARLGEYGLRSTKDVLYCFKEVIAMVCLNNLDELKEYIKNLNLKQEVIMANYANIGTSNFKEEKTEPIKKLSTLNGASYLHNVMDNVDSVTKDQLDEIDAINSIIDNTSRALEALKTNAKTIKDTLAGINGTNKNIEKVLVNTVDKLVLEYVNKQTMTKEEYECKLKQSYIIIDNLFNLNKDLRTVILNAYINYVNNLDVFNIVYQAINEVTFKGTLQDTASKLKQGNKKKDVNKPNFDIDLNKGKEDSVKAPSDSKVEEADQEQANEKMDKEIEQDKQEESKKPDENTKEEDKKEESKEDKKEESKDTEEKPKEDTENKEKEESKEESKDNESNEKKEEDKKKESKEEVKEESKEDKGKEKEESKEESKKEESKEEVKEDKKEEKKEDKKEESKEEKKEESKKDEDKDKDKDKDKKEDKKENKKSEEDEIADIDKAMAKL